MYDNMNIWNLIANILFFYSGSPFSKNPLQHWITVEKDGNILSAHYTSMAGLGEVCTHVGAVPLVVSSAIEIRSSRTVTQQSILAAAIGHERDQL